MPDPEATPQQSPARLVPGALENRAPLAERVGMAGVGDPGADPVVDLGARLGSRPPPIAQTAQAPAKPGDIVLGHASRKTGATLVSGAQLDADPDRAHHERPWTKSARLRGP